MKTPVLLLLDNLLSQDAVGVRESLHVIRQQLPPNVAAPLPPIPQRALKESGVVFTYLSAFLQTFPHLAAVGSAEDGSLPLHFAASSGDATLCHIVWQAFPTGAMTPNHKGKIPLHYAAREGRTSVVRFFLQVAPQTAAMASKKDKIALHFAAGEGHFQVVQALLQVYPQGAELPSAKGKLALHFCSRWGHEDVALELLKHYPDAIRALDWEGSLPLHEACREGQTNMVKFLVERFPEAAAVSNIRNELPLLRAVHANSLEVVLELLQVWPEGASHVLQHVTIDDRVASWNPNILEALLRATVERWNGFAPWQALPPTTLRLHAKVNHVLPMDNENDVKDMKKKKDKSRKEKKDKSLKTKEKKKEDLEVGPIEDREARLWTVGPFTTMHVDRNLPVEAPVEVARSTRCKSPILQHHDDSSVRPRKRARSAYRRHSGDSSSTQADPVWNPLYTALAARATLPVLKHLQQLFPDAPLDVIDHDNKSMFHLALENSALVGDESKNGGVDWILEHLHRPEWVARREMHSNALPLHTALLNRASSRLVKSLLWANPSSAVDSCGTRDEWQAEKPLTMACDGDCDYSTVYLLLRADPSAVQGESEGLEAS